MSVTGIVRRRIVNLTICVLLVSILPRVHAAEPSSGRRLSVGPNQQYKSPSAAAGAAHDGDTIEIDAGEYPGDVAVWSANRLTIRGMNGVAHLNSKGKSVNKKAIWILHGNDTTVENVEFSGCKVPDRNGAGIRLEGKGLVVRHCNFHDNENGILTGANPESDVLVEYSEFHHNGYGDGQSHNLYIGHVRSFTMQFCSSHHARNGHIVKSRAETNSILYNRLMDEKDGTSSYVINLPNGGKSFIIGNLIQHGPHAKNGWAVSYAEEGAKNAVQELYMVNNTYVNEAASGNFLHATGKPTTVRVVNNLVVGSKNPLSGGKDYANNLTSSSAKFVDAAHYDYRLSPQSPALAAGIDPGKVGDFSLSPAFYCHQPLEADPRPKDEKLNVGAFSIENKK